MESLLDVVNCIGFSYICLLVYFYLVSLCSICGFKLAEIDMTSIRCVQVYCFLVIFVCWFIYLFCFFVFYLWFYVCEKQIWQVSAPDVVSFIFCFVWFVCWFILFLCVLFVGLSCICICYICLLYSLLCFICGL